MSASSRSSQGACRRDRRTDALLVVRPQRYVNASCRSQGRRLMSFLGNLFGPRDPEARVKRLIESLTYRSRTAANLEAEIDRFEQANPMLAALGNAFGGIGFGRSQQTSAALNSLKDKQRSLEQERKREQQIRADAAVKLGELRHPLAVQALIVALEDHYPHVRCSAAKALGASGDKQAIEPLRRRSEDPKEAGSVKQCASEALEELRRDR